MIIYDKNDFLVTEHLLYHFKNFDIEKRNKDLKN